MATPMVPLPDSALPGEVAPPPVVMPPLNGGGEPEGGGQEVKVVIKQRRKIWPIVAGIGGGLVVILIAVFALWGPEIVKIVQDLRSRAAPIVAGSGNLISSQTVVADGVSVYTIVSNVNYPQASLNHIKYQEVVINELGDNAGKTRGHFVWAQNRADLPPAKGEVLSCTCGNNNLCLPAAGFATLATDKGAEYIGRITRCETWSNPAQTGSNLANHVFVFDFTADPKWSTDGPNTLNDIAVRAIDLGNQVLDWLNSDTNFNVPAPAIAVVPSPTPTSETTPTPTSGPTPTPTPTRVPTPTPTARALTVTPTPTVVAQLPEAGIGLPTLGALGGGLLMIVIGIILAL